MSILKKDYIEELASQLFTIRDVIRFGASQFEAAQLFYGHGTDNAWDEALHLTYHILHLPLTWDKNIANCRLVKEERINILELFLKRITQRLPAPYLTHQAWFAQMPFYVDERVIIPRSPIGEIILRGFQLPQIEINTVNKVLDLCCGSGCIAIAAASNFPHLKIDAVDISPEALAVAEKNVAHYHLEHQITLIASDLFSNLQNQRYDLILCNPPYVDAEEMANLPPEYRFEPELALSAGRDGLLLAKKILKEAATFLTATGCLILEVGKSWHALQQTYPQIPFLWLDFEFGGEGVLLITHSQLQQFSKLFI
jgi:ribosomal protein L3 glutamine methyltransferase